MKRSLANFVTYSSIVIILPLCAARAQTTPVETMAGKATLYQADSLMTLPPMNPYLANSVRPEVHGNSDSDKISIVGGPTVPSHQLQQDEMIWKALGPFEAEFGGYSSVYPDGKRTIVLGANQGLVKLDADTLQTLATYSVRSGKYYTAEEVNNIDDELDKVVATGDRQKIFDQAAQYLVPAMLDPGVSNYYTFINNKNERLFFFTDPETEKHYLRFYGDAKDGDEYSNIVLRREFEIPDIGGRPFIPYAAGMTFDGWVVVVSNTGMVLAISSDFKQYYSLDLAPAGTKSRDSMQSFVRNGISVDDKNGIYVVTQDFLARVQWTGKGLTMDPSQGAWEAKYPSGARGSGTTPALMGFGPHEDHLVVVTDGVDEDPHIMVFWRDAIPSDWKGISGYDRRVAGVSSVIFAPGKKVLAHIENSPPVMGYGVFAAAETPSQPVPPQSSVIKQFLADTIDATLTGSEATGGTKWEWDPLKRELRLAWITPLKLAGSICTPDVNGLLYCIGRREGQYTLEGIDWKTGKSVVHYGLGNSFRLVPDNDLVVAPNGAVDLFSPLGMGLMRMQPKS